jgi:hypothetical protein
MACILAASGHPSQTRRLPFALKLVQEMPARGHRGLRPQFFRNNEREI